MAQLEHLEEGFAYKDGEATRLYDPTDEATLHELLFQKCIDWSYGPLNVHACLDTGVPSITLQVTLAGVTIADCTLSPDHPECKIGGSVLGFKAELDLVFDVGARTLTISGEVCLPFDGCQSFGPIVISFGS